MAPLDIVGVWIVGGRREQEQGLHLAQHPQTVTNQVTLTLLTTLYRVNTSNIVKAVSLKLKESD